MSKRYQGGVLGVGFNPLRAPDAPTIGTATAGDTTASVAFTAPANVGGSAITSYAVQSTPGGIGATGSSSPITVSGLTNGTAYTFRVTALNSYGPSPASASSNSVTPAIVQGQQAYTTAGTYSWVAPAGVTSVSVVAVGGGGGAGYQCCFGGLAGGGGGLRYYNSYAVTPGSSYSVVVGAGGANRWSLNSAGGSGGCSTFHTILTAQGGTGGYVCGGGGAGTAIGGSVGGGNGGNGGARCGGGGGGGGGYSGAGGRGARGDGTAVASAGSGGGGGGGNNTIGGGGVGLLGQGSNGVVNGGGGSGGASATGGNNGAIYGGGAGSGPGSTAGIGAVRIIWPGTTRSFPSTNTGNL
jgi:hypothetical protein